MEKEVEVGNVGENLKQQQKLLQELNDHSQERKIQPSSSDYQYAYMHMQCKNEIEEYEMEQRVRKLQAENLSYKMQFAIAGSQKCALETEMQALIQEVATLKTAQANLEQNIEKCVPPLPSKPRTQPPVLPKPNTQLPPPLPPKNRPSLSKPPPPLPLVLDRSLAIAKKYPDLHMAMRGKHSGKTLPAVQVFDQEVAGSMKTSKLSPLLEPQCKPNWRRCADLPVAVSNAHLVKMEHHIYCAGVTGKVDTSRLVFKYDTTKDTWSSLPTCPTRYHGLSELNGRLVSIGGVKYDAPLSNPTNNVYTFQKSKWVAAIPAMNTARFDLSAFTFKTYLIVCGGVTSWTSVQQFTCTSAVEMFTTECGQWNILAPLPLALHLTSIVISDGRCYVLGGEHQRGTTNRAYSADLDRLVRLYGRPSVYAWDILPDCPLYGSTAAGLWGDVLALGGRKSGTVHTSSHVYSHDSATWRRAAVVNLPFASYYVATASLAENSIIVVGGLENSEDRLNTVFIANFEN